MTTFTTEDRLEALKAIEGDDEIQHAQTQEPEADNQPKSFWNHRVVRMPDDGLGNQWLEVQEVYYNQKGEPCGYCNSYVGGETLEELAEQIERHSKALVLPILDSGTDFNNKWEDEYEKEY
jgi:hypothetical protein